MNAMKELDAKLAAYLAADSGLPTKMSFNADANANKNHPLFVETSSLPFEERGVDSDNSAVPEMQRLQNLEIFKHLVGIKLEMEALTLQPEGTKRMELLQNDIRPIFTVECQLSHELIKAVQPRYDMFHIMQFESEKFQSLTQCTRFFGQEAERAVKLQMADELFLKDVENNIIEPPRPNLGRIHFSIWWREPGTCLNEMLGMGLLELSELYEAALLEQCKRIEIKRRNILLAYLYFKISLKIDPNVWKKMSLPSCMAEMMLLPIKQQQLEKDAANMDATGQLQANQMNDIKKNLHESSVAAASKVLTEGEGNAAINSSTDGSSASSLSSSSLSSSSSSSPSGDYYENDPNNAAAKPIE